MYEKEIQELAREATPVQAMMLILLSEMLDELRTIRQATEQANEPGPDGEPSPLQSLSD